MQHQENTYNISVTWRGKKFGLEINSSATLQELGQELQKLTNVKADTMRLIVPQSFNRSSKLLSPFSDEHSALCLPEISFLEGKSITMMGVPEVEVNEVLKNAKANLRIVGFEEEEKRLRQRVSGGPRTSLKLPQGPYVFCDFRTLHIPGIELNPPPSEALKRMHMLAADPGINAIMNKHRWRVGIMTEMAPVGYVGVSPKCILGFNMNHGEEISLRLRTDDLKGFRKYESIKKTLLHELAHMVYSEHDADFFALDKQLNQEAASLDWTRSRSHTLSGVGHSEDYEEEFYVSNGSNVSHKLGGNAADQLPNARASSVAAAYARLENASSNLATTSKVNEEPDPDDSESNTHEEETGIENRNEARNRFDDDEPDPDDSEGGEAMESEKYSEPIAIGNRIFSEPDPDDVEMTQFVPSNSPIGIEKVENVIQHDEPDPDDEDVLEVNDMENQIQGYKEPDPDDSQENGVVRVEPDPDDSLVPLNGVSRRQTDEPDPDDQELRRIQDPVAIVCNRLQKAIEMLRAEVNPSEASTVLQTLFKIIRNVIENPAEIKFKRLRKANPIIQRNVANYKAAMEILFLIGFNEDIVMDEIGKAETYLVLKRNDPGLLWIAKSSLETCIAY